MKNLFKFIKNLFDFGANETTENELKTTNETLTDLNQVTLINKVETNVTKEEKPKKKRYYKKRAPKVSESGGDNLDKPRSTSKKSKNID